jgi:Zn-dependent protease
MKWSWTIGRIAGIKVRMHWTFLLLLGWVAIHFAMAGQGWEAAARGIGFVLAIFGCVILHECGHALVARRYGIVTEDITLLPIGGLARMQRIPERPEQEFWIAIAGPMVNVAIAAVLFAILAIGSGMRAATAEPSLTTAFLVNLMWVNVILVLFNMLPAFPMDGGRVLRAVLAMRIDYVRATNIAAGIGQAMAILFGMAGLFVNPLLLLIALFVFLGAEAEASSVRLRGVLGDTPVRDAMITRFQTLSPHDSLQKAVDELLAGSQQDFPVLEDANFRGMLRRKDLIEALRGGDGEQTVADAQIEIEEIVREDDRLHDVLELMRRLDFQSLPVFRGTELVGMVSLENVGELVMVRGADDRRHQPQDVDRMVHAA